MRASNFNLYLTVKKPKRDYPETAHPKGCSLCGGKPVLYTVGNAAYCKAHKDQAFATAKESREV